ncbi:hypothetical protein J5N97_023620 [Dioscorea zingiberensis]|uniref:Uncharacterized protein n=1 Tax=Dioscorea zingiberensis TaxID=325984 RepID=A0A9D5C5L3_9LILI|nr:hypothetical protein J5N97_023620 [Dioscorea zingiberensis]
MRSKSKESPQSQSKRSDTSPNPIEAAKPPKIVVKNLNSAFSDISEEITPDPSIPSALVTDPDISAVDLLEASITSPDAMDQESVVPKKPTKELIAMDVPEPKREIGNSDTMKKVREEKGWSSNQESLMKLNIGILCALTWAALLANFLLVFPLHGSRAEGTGIDYFTLKPLRRNRASRHLLV